MTKILLAEDDDDMRRFLEKALDRAGYRVVAFDNGASAYDRLREEPFTLLLTDIVMPETDEIYGRKLLANEALERIDTIYKPYHTQLRSLLAETHAKFGYSVLIDCHSMPSAKSGSMRKGRPDFVLGDRFGTSCSQQVTWAASQILSAMGYDIEINKPYAGGFITEHYGRPDQGFHAIQIEINRGLYMNEQKLEKNARFDAVCRDITRFVSRLVAMPGDGLSGDQQIAAE